MCISIYEDLNEEQRAALHKYKEGGAYQINSHLLGHPGDGLVDGESIDNIVRELDTVIEDRPNVDEITLYRATDDAYLQKRIESAVLTYPAYMSTCTDIPSMERHFSGGFFGMPTALIISCPANTPMACMDTELFGEPENELLLGRERSFRITYDQLHDKSDVIKYMGSFYGEGHDQIRVMKVDLIT